MIKVVKELICEVTLLILIAILSSWAGNAASKNVSWPFVLRS